ncbi:uncharacterized protein MCAP_0864-like isoform X1 [Mytilus edulis]|uniref:uncharacterized protein MCAP_0864-like isoform X1 n=1 Tax=Mytilus edulis TaxID=6550 RepID=UPI0039F07A7B
MATSLSYDISIDALPSDENYKPNTVSRGYREQHKPQANGENPSPEETESAVFNEYLAINRSNDSSCPSSFAEYLERFNDSSTVVGEVVGDGYPSREMSSGEAASYQKRKSSQITKDEDDNIHRFFLELTATSGLSWTIFLADLGYNSKELLKLPGNQRDIFFFQYLLHWLETVTRIGFNPIKCMYRALLKTRDKDLIDKFKRQIQSDSLDESSDQEFEIIKGHLSEIDISNQNKKSTCIKDRKEQIMYVERDIWSNITPEELKEIKAFLRQTKKEKFPKKKLEEIQTGVDLMQKLHETCLITEDDLSYLKSILHFLKRDDLIVKITELESPGFVFQKELSPVKQIVSQSISIDHASPKSNHKQLEFFHSTRIIENNISAKTKEILQTDCRTKELTTASDSCRQNMEKCAKELVQIEAQIKKLQSDANNVQSKNASLGEELSSLNGEIKKEKKLHQQQTSELDLYKSTLEKETKKQEELKKKQTLEEEKKLQLQEQKPKEYENRRRTIINENKKQSQQKKELEIPYCGSIEKDSPFDDEDKTAKPLSRYESHITRDESTEKEVEAAQAVPQCASLEEARARPLKQELTVEPLILMMAAEENKSDLKSFKSDVLQEAPRSVTLNKVHEIIIERNTTEEFLNRTDEEMPKAVLLFILVSDVFAKRCWPDISKIKNLTAALYGSQPLVVPVIIKANVKPPMGLNSAHSLRFYTRDSYYKDALRKLLGQLN